MWYVSKTPVIKKVRTCLFYANDNSLRLVFWFFLTHRQLTNLEVLLGRSSPTSVKLLKCMYDVTINEDWS